MEGLLISSFCEAPNPKISHLSSINDSLTKYQVVQEILLQYKERVDASSYSTKKSLMHIVYLNAL